MSQKTTEAPCRVTVLGTSIYHRVRDLAPEVVWREWEVRKAIEALLEEGVHHER